MAASPLSSTTLDLSLLNAEPLTIVDKRERVWRIFPDLPLSSAVLLIKHADALTAGKLDQANFDVVVQALRDILAFYQPETTLQDVLEGFTVTDAINIISFLSYQVTLSRTTPSNPTLPTSSPSDTAVRDSAVTPMPTTSKRHSAAAK